LLHPRLDAIVLVPICPHTLSNRPIAVRGDSVVEVVVSGTADAKAQVTCDGQVNFPLVAGDRLEIRKKVKPICLIQPNERDYYGILRAKLHWGTQLS
jgi:NAD+ kinase